MKSVNKIISTILIIICLLSTGIVINATDSEVSTLPYEYFENYMGMKVSAKQELIKGSVALSVVIVIFLLILLFIKKFKLKEKNMNFNLKLIFFETVLISITEIGALYRIFDTAGELVKIQPTLMWDALKGLVMLIIPLIAIIASIKSIIKARRIEENKTKNIISVVIESIVVIGITIAVPFVIELITYIF